MTLTLPLTRYERCRMPACAALQIMSRSMYGLKPQQDLGEQVTTPWVCVIFILYWLKNIDIPVFLAKVSFLRRKTNNTQAPGLDTPRCVTLGGLYTAAERIQPAEQEQRPG